MPLVKKVRKRGANLVVVANGELLFVPGGQVSRWNNSLSQRVRNAAAAHAPSNKRPRWAHYGKPLKGTMRTSTDIDTAQMRVHTAIGSTAPYSAYVDQGTGIYGGKGPYEAKILPPWTRGSPSLYEHTWNIPERGYDRDGRAITNWRPQGTVTIKGQKGQFFFDRALRDGFHGMRLIATVSRGPMMSKALASFPDHLAGFAGNTPWSFTFDVQLREWRIWRDEAWYAGKVLGKGYNKERYRREYRDVREQIDRALSREARLARDAERKRNYRARKRDESGKPRRDNATRAAYAAAKKADEARFHAAMIKKYGAANVDENVELVNGRWEVLVKVGRKDWETRSAPAKFLEKFK